MATQPLGFSREVPSPGAIDGAAHAYDAVAADYLRYADGSGARLFDFDSRYAFADRELWARIEAALIDLRTRGRHALRILDLGCGPGTWTLRTALRARALGFVAIEARGVDISSELIAMARESARPLADSGMGFHFDMLDLGEALAEQPATSFDLVLCLYGVLNHLPAARHAAIAGEMARVTDGHVILTVRAAGSLASVFVTGVEDARAYHLDHASDRLAVDLKDGRHLEFNSHLFTADELRALFGGTLRLRELTGLDLFHSRFAHDPHWHGDAAPDAALELRLAGLEHLCAHDPALIDHAAHILLHGCTEM